MAWLLLFLFGAAAYADNRVTLSYVATSRGAYVFRGSDATATGNLGLAGGKTYGASGKAYAIRPYGLEVAVQHDLGVTTYLSPTLRIMPTAYRLTPSNAEQSGVDGFLTLGAGFLGELTDGVKAGGEFSLRIRRWQLENGAVPSTTHAGAVVTVRLEGERWGGLFEAGLMGMGIGTPASLGRQRDASTLRTQLGCRIDDTFRPWVEFLHTHRDFYGTTLVTGESSLFLDDAALSLGLSVRL